MVIGIDFFWIFHLIVLSNEFFFHFIHILDWLKKKSIYHNIFSMERCGYLIDKKNELNFLNFWPNDVIEMINVWMDGFLLWAKYIQDPIIFKHLPLLSFIIHLFSEYKWANLSVVDLSPSYQYDDLNFFKKFANFRSNDC